MSNDVKIRAINRAMVARDHYGLKTLDQVDIFNILTKENISIIFKNFTGKISGFYLKKGELGLVLINNSKTLGHQYFTAAHELYHYTYEKDNKGRICLINSFDQDNESEVEANYFASYFLMPDDALRYNINLRTNNGKRELYLRDIIFLENYFKVSHSLMLIRLVQDDFLSKEQSENFKTGIIKECTKLGYDPKLYKPSEERTIIISNYAELASELYENGKISYGKYEEILISGNYGEILFGEENTGDLYEDYQKTCDF